MTRPLYLADEVRARLAQYEVLLARVAELEAAARVVVEHWDGYNEGEWGDDDPKGARALKRLAWPSPRAASDGRGCIPTPARTAMNTAKCWRRESVPLPPRRRSLEFPDRRKAKPVGCYPESLHRVGGRRPHYPRATGAAEVRGQRRTGPAGPGGVDQRESRLSTGVAR